MSVENRRKYFRHQFGASLCAEIKILSIGNQLVNSNMNYVCVRDIGAGGMRFESHLSLPTREDIKLEITTTILEKPILLQGVVKRQIKLDNGYYQYGLTFDITEEDSNLLLRLINELSVKSQRSIRSTGCSLCTSYIKCHKNEQSKLRDERWNRTQ